VSLLENRVAVITGASGGIGTAIARVLAREGAQLCLIGRNAELLRAVARGVDGSLNCLSIHVADLGVDEDIDRLAAEVNAICGGVDVLVHSAGVISVGEIERAPVAEFDHQYRINVRAAYLLTQRLLPTLKDRQGQIVFINSSVGLKAKAGAGQYAATKHALRALADSLRDEVNAFGVRVISVYPGQTATPMQARLYEVAHNAYVPERLLQPSDVAEVVLSALSLPRGAEVTDITVRSMRKPQPR